MAYEKKPNPYLSAEGKVIPGKIGLAMEFAKAEDKKWLDSLPAEERAEELRQRRQLHEHMNVALPAGEDL